MTDDLPEGWTHATIAEITENHDGQRVPVKADDRKRRRGAYPYYGASGVIDTIDDYLFDGDFLLVAEDGANLLSRSTPIAFRASGRFWVNNHAHVVKTHGDIPLEFVEMVLNGTDLQHVATGSAQPKLTQAAMNSLAVLLPPLAEQRRIVAKVEALLAQVNAARERLAKVPLILKRFRQAVLAAACSGKLTEEWRQASGNTQSAAGLLESCLAERREVVQRLHPRRRVTQNGEPLPPEPSDADLPPSWIWASGEQLFLWGSGKFLPTAKMRSGPIPVYGGNGVSGSHDESLVDRPAIVVGRVGAQCGNVHVTDRPAWVTDNAIYSTWVAAGLRPSFAALVLSIADLNSDAGGSGQPFVNQEHLNRLALPLPTTEEQTEIVQRVDTLYALARAIEHRVAAASVRTTKLPSTILSKALSGDLVPTEAELAKAEGRSYEPASVLLEKIRAEKERGEAAAVRGVVRHGRGTRRRGGGAAQSPHPRAPSPRRRERGSKKKP